MKKYSLILVFALLSIPIFSNAQSMQGGCSSHGGIDIAIGADSDGSVICNDGWINSTVFYAPLEPLRPSSCWDQSQVAAESMLMGKSGADRYGTASANSVVKHCQDSVIAYQASLLSYQAQLQTYNTNVTHQRQWSSQVTQQWMKQQTEAAQNSLTAAQNTTDQALKTCQTQFGAFSIPTPNKTGYCSCQNGYTWGQGSLENTCVLKPVVTMNSPATTTPFANQFPAQTTGSHTAGTNVSSGGTVYMITVDGQKRPYTSAGAFLSYSFNTWTTVVPASSADLSLPDGKFIPPRDGKIICSDRGTDKGTCYLITSSTKAGFTSSKSYTGLGFSFGKASNGDVSWMVSGDNISDTQLAHKQGVLVNDSGTYKLVISNGVVGIPDGATLQSWGYSFDDAVTANSADKALSQIGILQTRQAGQLAPY